jgi:hypothetical protein
VLWRSIQSRNFPGRRLPTTSSLLLSARISALKIEHKGFCQNLKALPFKMNAQPTDLFAMDTSVKQLCNLVDVCEPPACRPYGRCLEVYMP